METRDLITNPSLRNIFRLSWPTILSYLALLTVNIVDLYFVGGLGREAIAAVSLAGVIWFFLCSVFDGLRQATTIMISGYVGENKTDKIGLVLNFGLGLGIVLSLPIVAFSGIFSKFIYSVMSNDPEVARIGAEYLPMLLRFSFATFLFFVIEGFFRGLGNTFIPMVISAGIASLNVVLDYGLVLGRLGMPELGVKGAVIATVIAQVLGLIAGIIAIFWVKEFREVVSFDLKVNPVIDKFVRIGSEVGLFAASVQSTRCIFTAMIGHIGTLSLAAHQIASQVFYITFLPAMAFMISASIVTSALVGADKLGQIRSGCNRIIIVSMTTVTTIGIVVWLFSHKLAAIFSPTDPQVRELGAQAIKIIAIHQAISAYYFVMRGVLSGVGMADYVMVTAFIASYVWFLPLVGTVFFYWGYGLLPGYIAMVTWSVVFCVLLAWRYFSVVADTRKLRKFLRKPEIEAEGVEQGFAGMTGLSNPADILENPESGVIGSPPELESDDKTKASD